MSESRPKIRVAVLISGRGSNMRALVEAAREADYPAEIVCVVSNRPDAAGLDWAKGQGLPALALDHTLFPSRDAFEDQLERLLIASRVDVIALAGFLRLFTAGFVERWRDRMLNIHPSLLPAFKGLDTHERALAAGVKITGATVHLVQPEMDDGPILGQAAVPVLPGDTPKTLGARVLAAEHRLYPHVLRLFLAGGKPAAPVASAGHAAPDLFSPPLAEPLPR